MKDKSTAIKMTKPTSPPTTTTAMAKKDRLRIVPSSVMFKLRGSDSKYQEALEASSKFNKQICRERQTRIPFIDSQTRVAQTNCLMWYMKYQREENENAATIHSYPSKKWYKTRRLIYEDSNDHLTTVGPAAAIIQRTSSATTEPNGIYNENSNSMDATNINGSNQNGVSINPIYKHILSATNDETTMNGHENSNDDSFNNSEIEANNDNNNNDSDDDFEMRNNKNKKKGGRGSGRKRSEISDLDKPFSCESKFPFFFDSFLFYFF
jgi:zinc finger protein ubi-d4